MTIDCSNKSKYRIIINVKGDHNTYIFDAVKEDVLSNFLYRNLGNTMNKSKSSPEYVEASLWCNKQYIEGVSKSEYNTDYLHILYEHIAD